MDRPDETAAETTARETTEGHVKGVEEAAGSGMLSREQAERVIDAGQRANRSHDMARGIINRKD